MSAPATAGGCVYNSRRSHAVVAAAPSAAPQAFLMRKLKIQGSMALAMKLQPILDAAAPKSKL